MVCRETYSIYKIYLLQDLPHHPSPSMPSKRFITGEPTMPEPRGAGIKRQRTEPHLPWTCRTRTWKNGDRNG